MGFARDIGLTFGVTAEVSQAVAGIGLVTAAIGTLEAVTVDTGLKFADFGKRVHDIEQETGLTARTVSTLSAATDFLSNTSMPQVNKAIDIYLAKLSEAAHGQKQAAENFQRFGLDAKAGIQDPDKAVISLINHLAQIPNSAERMDAIKTLAGRGGAALADLAEQVRQMGGSFEGFQKQAEAWGVVLSEEDVRAAEQFRESTTIMGEKVEGIVFHVGRDVMPELGKAIDDIGFALGANLADWDRWGLP